MEEQILGDYRIVKQIGVGTLGNVLLAEHRFIKKLYVLKVLPFELSQEKSFQERFEEEVAKIASLEHPNIVKVYTVCSAEGLYFLVTDCIKDTLGESTNLAQYMSAKKERLREEELQHILRQVADALDYAHDKGVAHRSLKLNNILLGKGNTSEVFLSDFGLEKIVGTGNVVLHSFKTLTETLGLLPQEEGTQDRYSPLPFMSERMSTLSHSFLQSYAFLAPEQKRYEQVGVQADSFAFGILAYFLISGQFPEGTFPLPSEIAPDFINDWDRLILDCLRPDPKVRPVKLLPYVDRKKTRSFTPNFSPPQPLRPVEEKSSAVITPPPPLEEKVNFVQTLSPTIEQLKASALRPLPIPPQEKEESTIKPFIQLSTPVLQSQEVISSPAIATLVSAPSLAAEMKEQPVEAAESYAQQLTAMLKRDPVVTQYQPEKKEHHETEPLQTEMKLIQGGGFLRGSNSGNRDEMPAHRIILEPFAIDIHPVTNEQFVRFLEYMGGEKDHNYNDLIRLKDSRLARTGGKLSIESGYSKHPVVGVTWYGAVAYAQWIGKRLPTEAEWEVAARGGGQNETYPTGNQIEKSQANFFSSDTTPVMSYMPNGYGLYDMVGNIYEWCQDWYGYNYYEISANEPNQPKGPLQGVYRVLRGGCWKSLQEDLRSSHRHRNNPGTVNSTYGFRCASDVHN